LTGKVIPLENVISPDLLATRITERYIQWDALRGVKKQDWEEVRRYVYATDTTQTSNVSLPWKNKTTIPKMCQIRDNLFANYMATLFPKQKWLDWEAGDPDSLDKTDAILNYMTWVVDQPFFKGEAEKLIQDYIDFGNAIATVEWKDMRVEQKDKTQVGFVGPALRRISPLDIVFNPTAENFLESPKIIRSVISLGELKSLLERISNDENQKEYEELYKYLREIRFHAQQFQGDWIQKDRLYAMDGFTSFRSYLLSDFVEILTFYGDWYDPYQDTFEKNRVITVVDRHRLINNRPNDSFYGYPAIFHSPWRRKQDNLWGMGPLDNLVGMQYRLDHVENMKADVWDLVTYPVQKIKGFVEDFTWQPGEKIFVSEEGDVELITPDVNVFQSNMEINTIATNMEEMAGAPKEAMGIRSPGEKTKYEVQRLENASFRLFNNKILQFSDFLDSCLNAMLELAQRNLSAITSIRVFDDDYQTTTFQNLTVDDITGVGRIRAVGARHFAEQAELVQNLTALTGSGLWPTIQQHFSGITLAKVIETTFGLKDYHIVTPYVQLAEQADAQRYIQAMQEQLHQEQGTATGMGEDYDTDQHGNFSPPVQGTRPQQFGLQRNPPNTATPTGTLGTQ
jgi:hypothetical protein